MYRALTLLSFIIFVTGPSLWATISPDGKATSAFASASSLTFSLTVSTGLVNSELLVGCGADVPSSITSVKYAGVTMTQRVLQNSAEYSFIYSLNNPMAGANNVVITLGSAVNVICGGIAFSGVDQLKPIDGVSKIDSTTANPGTSITLSTACGGGGCWIMDTIFENGTTVATPAVQTSTSTLAFALFNAGGPSAVGGSISGPWTYGSRSLGWTVGSADWARSIIALRPATVPFIINNSRVTIQNGTLTIRGNRP